MKKTKIKVLDELKIPEKEIIKNSKRPSTPTIKRSPSIMHFIPQKFEEVKLKEKIEDKEEEKEDIYFDDEKEEKKEEKDDDVSVREIGDTPKDLSKKSLEKLKKEGVSKSLEKVFRVMEKEQKDDKLLFPSED